MSALILAVRNSAERTSPQLANTISLLYFLPSDCYYLRPLTANNVGEKFCKILIDKKFRVK